MSTLRKLEAPLRAWRSFRDIARATRSLAAAQSMHWAEQVRRAERHLAWCEAVAASYPKLLQPSWAEAQRHAGKAEVVRPRVALAFGSDLGLCGPYNRRVAERCEQAELAAAPTVLTILVGARLAALEPLPGAALLSAPTSFAAAERTAAQIEDLIGRLPDSLAMDLDIVVVASVSNDGQPSVDLRREAQPAYQLTPAEQAWLTRVSTLDLDDLAESSRQARLLARHARILAAACRAVATENEARWRTMSRAYESAQRRIGEQERRVRRLRQELITQEMIEARQGAASSPW